MMASSEWEVVHCIALMGAGNLHSLFVNVLSNCIALVMGVFVI